jgi:endoglucanase
LVLVVNYKLRNKLTLSISDSSAAWPTTADMDYFASKGMNIFRLPFKWERLQPTLSGAFDTSYANTLETLVNYATNTKGVYVLLDVHK